MKETKAGLDVLEKVEIYWERKRGILLLNMVLIILYFKFLFPVVKEIFPLYEIWIYVAILIPIILVTIYWIFNTNRLYFSNKKFTLGLIMRVDASSAEAHMKRIVHDCVKEIKNEFPDIKIILYPINYKKTEKDILRHIRLRLLPIDAFIVATVESGNIVVDGLNTNKIELSKFFFAGNFDVNENLNVFKSTISINNDLSLRLFYKNWSFIENNSFNDKKKIKHNLKDTLLHFSGIYLIYKQELEIALNILKALYKPELSKLKFENGKANLNREQIAALRLNHIILNLYYKTALDDYFTNKCSTKAYSLLLECNKTFPIHAELYDHLISLAYFAFQCGDVDNAILFTEQAQEIKGEQFEIILNFGFFALLKNDIDKLRHYYFRISQTKIPSDYVVTAIIDFFEEQRKDLPDRLVYIDFAQAILTKLYLEIEYGNNLINEFIQTNSNNEKLAPLITLCEDIRTNQILNIHPIQRPRKTNKNNRNNRKKLKRKRK